MAVDREKLAKFVNMLAADDMTALVAVRKIRDMAAAEKKLVSELIMVGPVVYQDRIVYRDAAPPRGPVREDIKEAMRQEADRAQAERRARSEQRRQRERAESEERRRRAYGSAFDDAEMTDEQREAARAARAERRTRFKLKRELLDELAWALENNNDDLTFWEIEFATSVPMQYEMDWELSQNQVNTARSIINKVKRNQGESPI